VAIPTNGTDDSGPPYPFLDNPDSLLDVTDIVFIDPPGTGFSRLIGKTDPKEFYGVTADAKAVAEVIRRWLNDNGRWNSPKYLGGESYGTSRSAAVVNQLEGSTYNDVALNGIILISTILDFAAGADTQGNELANITNLPSMAAVALYRGSVAGALLGLAGGAFLDLWRGQSLGLFALAAGATGYALGLLEPRLFKDHLVVPVVAAVAGTLLFQGGFLLLSSLTGRGFPLWN
jgi:hypothetical protein